MIARHPTPEFESVVDSEAPLLIAISDEKLDKARTLIPDLQTIGMALLGRDIDTAKEFLDAFDNLKIVLEDKADHNTLPIVLLRLSTVLQTKKITFSGHETGYVELCNQLTTTIAEI